MTHEPDWNAMAPVHSAVPPDIRAEIGSVVIFQGSIEYELRVQIARLLGSDPETIETATAELSYKQLTALLSSLVIRKIGKDNPLYQDFTKATGGLDQFEAFRNTVAHSHWSHSLVDISLRQQAARHKSTAKRGQGLKKTVVEVTLQELQLQLKKAYFYNSELYALTNRIAASTA